MKRMLLLAALVLLSCEPAVRRSLTLTFNDAADLVTISATTALGTAKAGTPEAAQIDEEREALLAGRDDWSVRFANADPESDRVVLQRTHGRLQSLEHVATILTDNLQKFFFDTPLTVNTIHGEGWAELTIVAGTSMRATRDQQQRVDDTVRRYSERAARYFGAVRSMYRYLDEKPQRAADLFAAVFRGDDPPTQPPMVSDKEQGLADSVRLAGDALLSSDGDPADEADFDHVFNPFPADIRVVLPNDPTLVEGFTKQRDGSLLIKLPTALEAVTSLQGRWISPDPLALALAADPKQAPEELAASIATLPRHAEAVVSPSDIAAAMIDRMRPAPRYRVRWITKSLSS